MILNDLTYIFANDFGHHLKLACFISIDEDRYLHMYGYNCNEWQQEDARTAITITC